MADKFTRTTVLLKWNGDATIRSFYVFVENYGGGRATTPKDMNRNLDGTLLVVRGTEKREFAGMLLLDHDASGTVDGATLGTDTDAKSAWQATDLKCQSFEDAAYWSAEPQTPWDPQVRLGPTGNERVLPLVLVEK